MISEEILQQIKHEDVKESPLRSRRTEKKLLEKLGGVSCCWNVLPTAPALVAEKILEYTGQDLIPRRNSIPYCTRIDSSCAIHYDSGKAPSKRQEPAQRLSANFGCKNYQRPSPSELLLASTSLHKAFLSNTSTGTLARP